jgi:hypothetical protein
MKPKNKNLAWAISGARDSTKKIGQFQVPGTQQKNTQFKNNAWHLTQLQTMIPPACNYE